MDTIRVLNSAVMRICGNDQGEPYFIDIACPIVTGVEETEALSISAVARILRHSGGFPIPAAHFENLNGIYVSNMSNN